MSYDDFYVAMQRASILRHLAVARSFTMSENLIHAILIDSGIGASLHQVSSMLAWLAEQGLVDLKGTVATLTPYGEDVAYGRASVTGVKRPDVVDLMTLKQTP